MFPITSTFSKTNSIQVIICLLSFLVFNSALCQQKNTVIEDDYETLKAKIQLYFNSSLDRSLIYAEQMAKSSNYRDLAFANGSMACLMQMKGQTNESKKRYKTAFYYLEKMPESPNKIRMKSYVYNYAAIGEYWRDNFSKALEHYQTALKFSTEMNDIKQIVRIKGNIAILNEAVGNYQLSIKNLKNLIEFIDSQKSVFTKGELLNQKSNFNRGLGSAYEEYFKKNLSKKYLLDSVEYYYKKTLNYSQNFITNKIAAQLSLGNVYNWKKDFKSAEKMYSDVVFLAQKNNTIDVVCTANYNLGDIYYSTKKYDKALVFFKKCDSLAAITKNNTIDYLKSNFYQAKIYTILEQPDLAYTHSKIYLDNYERYEAKISKEALEVNYKQGTDDLTAEMRSIEKKHRQDLFLKRILNVFYVLLLVGVVFLLIKNIKARKNMIALLEKSKAKKGELIERED